MQEGRFAIDDVTNRKDYQHRLMGYNNDSDDDIRGYSEGAAIGGGADCEAGGGGGEEVVGGIWCEREGSNLHSLAGARS
jgi:hypothetical protein